MRAVVLDTGAEAGLLEHLEIVFGARAQTLGLEELALGLELRELASAVPPRSREGALQRRVTGGVVRRREERELLHLAAALLGHRVEERDLFDHVLEERDADRFVAVGRLDLEGVALHPERAALEHQLVAVVLHLHQPTQQRALVEAVADFELQHPLAVLDRRAEAVNARDRGDDDGVAVGQQRGRGGVAQSVDLLVHRAVLLDEGVGSRYVGLGLVVVVVGDEELDAVLGQHLFQLRGQLRGQRLVRLQDQRRALHVLDQPRDRRGLAAAGDALERLVAQSVLDALGQLRDRLGLIAGRLERRLDQEPIHGRAPRRRAQRRARL